MHPLCSFPRKGMALANPIHNGLSTLVVESLEMHMGNQSRTPSVLVCCFPRTHVCAVSDWDSMERVWDHGLKTFVRKRRWMDGWMDMWMDGYGWIWMDGWMDGCVDG